MTRSTSRCSLYSAAMDWDRTPAGARAITDALLIISSSMEQEYNHTRIERRRPCVHDFAFVLRQRLPACRSLLNGRIFPRRAFQGHRTEKPIFQRPRPEVWMAILTYPASGSHKPTSMSVILPPT